MFPNENFINPKITRQGVQDLQKNPKIGLKVIFYHQNYYFMHHAKEILTIQIKIMFSILVITFLFQGYG